MVRSGSAMPTLAALKSPSVMQTGLPSNLYTTNGATMAGAKTLLWPFLGFLTVAALISWWQAHVAKRGLDKGKSQPGRDGPGFKERQEEIARFSRSRERRAAIFAAVGLAAFIYLTLVD